MIDAFIHPTSLQVDELRAQLNQMENMTIGKNQDLEDAVEECQSKVSL